MNKSQSRKRRAKRRGLLSSSELKLHLTKFSFFHSAHYLGYFLCPVHKLKFLMGVCTLQVGGEALGASTHLRDARELQSAWDSVGSAFVIAKSPNSPSARAPWCSAPRDPAPGQGFQNQVSAAAGTRRATSAFQLSGGCLSTRVVPPLSPRGRGRSSLSRLLPGRHPGAVLGSGRPLISRAAREERGEWEGDRWGARRGLRGSR